MLYVVPFVAKVIESSAKSKVFKPPNPWVMAIMSVLVELHQVPDLKVSGHPYVPLPFCLFCIGFIQLLLSIIFCFISVSFVVKYNDITRLV